MITRIILAVNENESYLQHVPLVCKAWKALTGIGPDVATVGMQASGLPAAPVTYHRIEPIEGMPSANQAKISRLFLAAQFPDEWCLLSDVDMLPLSAEIFDVINLEIERYPDSGIISHGADAFDHVDLDANKAHGQFPICYLCAWGGVWQDYATAAQKSPDAFKHGTEFRANPYVADFSDEAMLRWLGIETDVTSEIQRGWQNGMASRRIDRSAWFVDWALLRRGEYLDCHLPRTVQPYHGLHRLVDPEFNGAFR